MKTKKLRELNILIAYQYLSFKGGIEEVIYNQSKLLKNRGAKVELLTSNFGKNEPKQTENGIKINRHPSINVAYKKLGIPFAIPFPSFKTMSRIKNIIKKSDIVNVHGHPYLASFIYILISKILKKPVILTQHNTNIKTKSKFINAIYYIVDRTIGKLNLALSDKIIACSQETRKYIQTLTDKDEKIEVIYNGVDTKRFSGKNDKLKLRAKFQIPAKKFVCLTIRRLTLKNGIETFLNTAKLSDPKKTLFLLGGTGPDKAKIESYVKSENITNIKLLGFVKDEDLASYYTLSDTFILPSIQGEGFPMVVLESFSSGIPVIATKSGGHIEIVKNYKTGFVVPINNPAAIAKHIKYLMGNKSLLKTMSKNCQTLVQKSFTWAENIKQTNKLINGLVLAK